MLDKILKKYYEYNGDSLLIENDDKFAGLIRLINKICKIKSIIIHIISDLICMYIYIDTYCVYNKDYDDYDNYIYVTVKSSITLFSQHFSKIKRLDIYVKSSTPIYDVDLSGGIIKHFNCCVEKYYSQPKKIHIAQNSPISIKFMKKYNIDYIVDTEQKDMFDYSKIPSNRIMRYYGTSEHVKQGYKVKNLYYDPAWPINSKNVIIKHLSLDGLETMNINELCLRVVTQEIINKLEYINCKSIVIYISDDSDKSYDISPILRNKNVLMLDLENVYIFPTNEKTHLLYFSIDDYKFAKLFDAVKENVEKYISDRCKIVIEEY